MNHLHYRADIDGLRAVAVLAVIIYHGNAAWLPGGFVGVDIFFVISGFLITAIISQEMRQQHFSLANFYARRVRRILPPFFAVVVLVLLAGFFLLLPRDYADLAHSARYAVLFFSNHYFAAGNDYFAPASEEMPLLHTWSLAVEEQYYIVWPLLLLGLLRHVRRLQLCALVLAVASFLLATWMALDPALAGRAYYWMPGRFGELLMGGMLALYLAGERTIPLWAAQLTGVAGLMLVAGSCLLLDKAALFPGINALWPCLGAVLLIYAGAAPARSLASRMLALRPLVFIGLLSYSLYLWHWPILAFSRYQTAASALSPGQIAVAFGVTAVASYLSWRLVEIPVRRQQIGNRQLFLRYFWLPVFVLLGLTAAIKHSDGYLWRKDLGLHTLAGPALRCHNRIKPPCQAGVPGKAPALLMYGDSHAAHFTSYIDRLAQSRHLAVIVASADSCPVLSSTGFANLLHDKRRGYCAQLADFVQRQEAGVDIIVIAMRWEVHLGLVGQEGDYRADADFRELLTQKIDSYVAQGKKVYLLAQLPRFREPVLRMDYIGRNSENRVEPGYAEANRILAGLVAGRQQVHLVDFSRYILAWDNGVYQGTPAYMDGNHLNLYGQQALFEATRDHYDWLNPVTD